MRRILAAFGAIVVAACGSHTLTFYYSTPQASSDSAIYNI